MSTKKRVPPERLPSKHERPRWFNPKRFRARHRHPYMIDFFMAGYETRYCPSCTYKPLASFPEEGIRCKVCRARERQPIAPFLAPWTREGHDHELDAILARVDQGKPQLPAAQPVEKQADPEPTPGAHRFTQLAMEGL
jgi:hypothetical protein